MNKPDVKKIILLAAAVLLLFFAFLFHLSYKRMKSGNYELLPDDSPTKKAAHTLSRCYEDDAEFSSLNKNMTSFLKALVKDEGSDYSKAFFGKDENYRVLTLLYKPEQKEAADKLLSELVKEKNVLILSPENSFDKKMNSTEILSYLMEDGSDGASAADNSGEGETDEGSKTDPPDNVAPYQSLSTTVDYIFNNNYSAGEIKSFPDFCKDYETVIKNPQCASYFSGCEDTLALFSRLYAASEAGNSMNAEELAEVLGTDKATIDLYLSFMPDDTSKYEDELLSERMTLTELSDFLQKNVMDNSDYSLYLTYSVRKDLNLFFTFADKDMLNRSLSSSELASLLGQDETIISAVLFAKDGFGTKSSDLLSFVDYLLNEGKNHMIIGPYLDQETTSQLKLLRTIIINTRNNTRLNYSDISKLFGFDEKLTKMLYEYKYKLEGKSAVQSEKLLTIKELTSLLADRLIFSTDSRLAFDADTRKQIMAMDEFLYLENTGITDIQKYEELLSVFDKKLNTRNLGFIITFADSLKKPPASLLSLSEFSERVLSFEDISPVRRILLPDISFISSLNDSVTNLREFFNHENYTRVFVSLPNLSEKEERKLGNELLDKTKDTRLNFYGHALVMSELHDKYFGRLIVFGGIILVLLLLSVWFIVNMRAMEKGY